MPQDRPSSQDQPFKSDAHAAESTGEASTPGEGEFTRMFRALNNEAEPSTRPPFAPAPTQQADAVPPSASSMPSPPPFAASVPEPSNAGEFTQIFRQIPKPTSAPPVITPAAPAQPATPAESGEFTQVFRQIAPGSAVPPPTVPAQPFRAETPSEFTQMFREAERSGPTPATSPVPPAVRGNMPMAAAATTPPVAPEPAPLSQGVPGPGDFTQIFQAAGTKQAPASASGARSGAEFPFGTPAFAPPPAAAPPVSSGDFTQLFQALEDPPAQSASGASSPLRGSAPFNAAPFAQPVAPSTPVPQQPPPSSAAPGEFTQLMQGLGQSAPPQMPGGGTGALREPEAMSATPFAQPAAPSTPAPLRPAAAPAGPGEFTRLMQGLGQSEPGQSPSGASGSSRTAAPMSAPPFAQPAPPSMPTPPRPPAAPAGPGEFTRLMQGLNQSAPPLPEAAAPPLPAFGQPLSAPGGSEFTRVMRGSALRDKGGPDVPIGAAAAAQPVAARAPGLAIAPPSAPKIEAGGIKADKKLSPMMLALMLFNVLLVIALAVLASLLLHRKH